MLVEIKGRLKSLKGRIGIIREFLIFLWERKIIWMAPVFILLMIIGGLILFAESSALSPLIYPLV